MNFVQRLNRQLDHNIQLLLPGSLTPFGKLLVVEDEYIVLEQDPENKLIKNHTMIIPTDKILYVRPLE